MPRLQEVVLAPVLQAPFKLLFGTEQGKDSSKRHSW